MYFQLHVPTWWSQRHLQLIVPMMDLEIDHSPHPVLFISQHSTVNHTKATTTYQLFKTHSLLSAFLSLASPQTLKSNCSTGPVSSACRICPESSHFSQFPLLLSHLGHHYFPPWNSFVNYPTSIPFFFFFGQNQSSPF